MKTKTQISQGDLALVALDLGLEAPNLKASGPSAGQAALLGGDHIAQLREFKGELLENRNKANRLLRAMAEEAAAPGDLTARERERHRAAYDFLQGYVEQANEELDSIAGNISGSSESRGATRDRSAVSGPRTFGPRESLASAFGGHNTPGPGDPGSLGAIVLGQVGLGPAMQAAQSAGTGSAGGFMVPGPQSIQLIDLARNKARVIEAGALTLPMTTPTLDFARWEEDPTAAWRGENQAITESTALLSRATLKANALAALVTMSVELAEDAAGFQAALEQALAQALALEIDRAALYGTGLAQPLGLSNTSGVNEIQPPFAPGSKLYLGSHGPLSEAVQACMAHNVEAGGFIMAPRTFGELDRLQDLQNQPVMPPKSVADRQFLVTNQVPVNLGDNADESEVFTGLWSSLVIGMRTNIVLEASRISGTAFSKMQIQVRAYLRADALVVRPDHFAIVRAIRPQGTTA